MLRLFIVALFVVVSSAIAAQCNDGKLEKEVFGTIANQHRQNSAFTYGMVSYQSHADNYYYESAEEPAFYLGYGKSIWVGAKDTSGNIKVSANSFPYLSSHDFLPGPLDRETGQPIDTLCGVYNRVWVVKQIDVFQLQVKFQQGELTLADIPADILEWPAKGNQYLEEFTPDYDLAPFADLDGDGSYDPLSGDIPIVLTENPQFIPHQYSFIVFNDRAQHTLTRSEGMGIEFQQINYVVNCSEDSESEQSVFTRINYNYLGQEELTDFKISLWEDSDLACNQNDYEGCSRELNATYFYNRNGETFLEDCHDPDVPDNNGAIRTTVFMNHEMKTFKHWFLLGVGDTLVPGIDPTGGPEFYGYMSGLWRDGEPMTVGGNGYDPNSTDTTLFAFPDRPDDPNGWSMQTAQLKVPLDGRALTTLVDETTITNGASGSIDFADHFLYDKETKRLEVFEIWPAKIEALKADFEAMKDGTFNCGAGIEICLEDCVWPGDVNRDFAVTGKDFITAGVLGGYNLTDGIPRSFVSTEWFGFPSEDWSRDLGELNAKNGDVNGNGTINENDLADIAKNFGKQRSGYTPEKKLLTKIDSFGMRIEFEVEEVDLATAALFDKIVNTNIFLGDPSKALAAPLHGLSYELQFDTNLVRPFVKLDEIFSEVFQYKFSGILNEGRDGNLLTGDDRISYAYTNIDGNPSLSGGSLANQNLIVRDDAVTINADGVDTLVLRFYNVCAVNSEGDFVDIGAVNDTLVIRNLMVDPDLISDTEEFEETTNLTLFPNPVVDELTIEFRELQSGEFTVYDQQGKVLLTKVIADKLLVQLPVAKLESGFYILQFADKDNNTAVKTFVK